MQNMIDAQVEQTRQKAAVDPSAAQIRIELDGSWRMDDSQPQFGGQVRTPKGGDVLFESDFPPFLGGQGRRPSPLQYCFWGGMACMASTLAMTAAAEKIDITSLSMRTTGLVDFGRALGVGTGDPISGLTWEITVETDASQEALERLLALTEERCPASWMLRNVVPFSAKIVKA